MNLLIVASMLGVTLATAAVLAIWLALGRRTLMLRAILAMAAASVLALVFCAASGELEAEWLGLMWVVVVTIAAMFLFVRWLGFRLVDTTKGCRVQPDELQFSLTQLLVLTAVVAAIAAATRMLAPLVATMNALIFGLAIAFSLGTLALASGWAILRSEITRARLSALALFAIVIAGLVYSGMEATNADPGSVWGSVIIVYTFVLAGWLLLARSRGFRLL